eukprot:TRINITY_DN75821_c0_g1_i1.p1 TRINITY_DN75821_c0_g1~~TRINITY_DN75821_c0_g1_i1.p1  ORF type:complete len:185 (+),score=12.95 TRINITY_DN75821_c0_g1_i1:84-638(+)
MPRDNKRRSVGGKRKQGRRPHSCTHKCTQPLVPPSSVPEGSIPAISVFPPVAQAIIDGRKRVENRSWGLRPGWYALHTNITNISAPKWKGVREHIAKWPPPVGETTTVPAGHLVALFKISGHYVLAEGSPVDVWTTGPVVNEIAEVRKLDTAIKVAKGNAGLWYVKDGQTVATLRKMVPLGDLD